MVTLIYNGTRFILDPALDAATVEYRLLERLNHIAHYSGRLDRRPYNRGSAELYEFNKQGEYRVIQQFDPIEVFPLHNGGHIHVFLHENVNLVIESTEPLDEISNRFEDQQ